MLIDCRIAHAGPAPRARAGASNAAEPTSPKAVTIEWWHITTGDPGKSVFQGIADAYMAAHPNVKINITILENEAFKTKLATSMQSGEVPDLFQSWGGGIMAAQADAGVLKDITADVAPWKDTINPGALSIYAYNGKQYGVPWDMGMIGVWYNKALFTKAGISAPPATWDEFLADVTKLKAAGIVPLAIAGKDMWPSMHLWTYLALRIGGGDALAQMVQSGDWNTDACTAAGDQVLKLNALNPYQPGFKGATYDNEAAAVGNAKAAMEVMGQWAPGRPGQRQHQQEGHRRRPRLVPVPDRRRRHGRCDRRRRRRQRHRGRQERVAGSPRLPQVLQQRRERDQAQRLDSGHRPLAGDRHRERRHGCEPPGRPGGPRQGHLHAALPRPGDLPGHGHRDQRRDHRPVRRRVDPGQGLRSNHHRGGCPVGHPGLVHR